MIQQSSARSTAARLHALTAALVALLATLSAHASALSGDALAKAANVIAIVVIFVVPIVVVVVFWLVHVLPEKIAHKNYHPQTKAIQVLCLLSLVFGGMLWPLAWLWAYTKPVGYKLAYGRDKADEYYEKIAATDGAQAENLRHDIAQLRADFERLMAQGGAPDEFKAIRDRLAALEPRLAATAEEAR